MKIEFNEYWKNWTLNCAFGELIGIACAGGIAYGVNSAIGDNETLSVKLIILVFMLLAGFIEGAILGLFQWKVLVKKFPKLPKKEWLFYTIQVGVLGWLLGMLPSLFWTPTNDQAESTLSQVDFTNPVVYAFLCVLMGLILGSIFGLFQWFSLKNHAHQAYKWIIANALGWGLGLGWIFLFASLPTQESSLVFNVSMGILGGILAGLSVGAITGIYLINLKMKDLTD